LGEGPATFSSSNDDNINLSEDAVRIEMPPHAQQPDEGVNMDD